VKRPDATVELPRGHAQVRDRVQAPVDLDELPQRHVIGNGGSSKLSLSSLIGEKVGGVRLAIERPTAALASLTPPDLPSPVGFAMDVHRSALLDRA
jgi:hypothetical protein